MDREHKKMLKDYVKSITKIDSGRVLEWTAGDMKEYDYDLYSLESIFNAGSVFRSAIIKNSSLTIWYTRRCIKQGKIYLRVKKVNLSKPPRFREKGWAIRNQSTRADKTLFGRSMTFLSTEPKKKWRFWKV